MVHARNKKTTINNFIPKTLELSLPSTCGFYYSYFNVQFLHFKFVSIILSTTPSVLDLKALLRYDHIYKKSHNLIYFPLLELNRKINKLIVCVIGIKTIICPASKRSSNAIKLVVLSHFFSGFPCIILPKLEKFNKNGFGIRNMCHTKTSLTIYSACHLIVDKTMKYLISKRY